jgi:hypothetical protein
MFHDIMDRILYYTLYPVFLCSCKKRAKVESFVISNKDINILDSSKKLTKRELSNLLNYLRHHIMYTDHPFVQTDFDEPLVIRFKYKNEIYRICLSGLKSRNTEHGIVKKEPRILSAVVGDECITDIINEYHGPEQNFFGHIPDSVSCPRTLLSKELQCGDINIFDSLGNTYVVKIKQCTIKSNRNSQSI